MASFLYSDSFKPLALLVVTLIASEVVLVSTIGLICFDRDDAAIREYLERNHAGQEIIDMFDPEIETPYLQYIAYRIFIVIGRVFIPTESLLINCLLQMAIHLTSVILSIGITILIGLCIDHFDFKANNWNRNELPLEIMRPIFLFLSLLSVVNCYKFLVYSSQSGKSHVNFLARITDILVDAGHEVVMLSPIMNSLIGGPMTDKARVIEIPQCKESAEFEEFINNQMSQNVWVQSPFRMFFSQSKMFENWVKTCESVIHHKGLIEQLKAEKFDAAYGESFEACGPVIFHLVGIEKWAITESIAIRDGGFYISQTPGNPAYVPSLMAGSKDEMTFFGRLLNTFSHVVLDFMMEQHYPMMAERIRQSYPDLPEIREIIATNSLVFLNSEPLVDFPKITSARVIDYGGIVTSSEHKPLNQTWSSILDLRPRTVLLSFGTVARAHAMPEEYKQTIRKTFLRFPNVTFIWKYEKPEDKVSEGIPNLIESTWVPQRDMLHDSRLSAFITHCGQGSTTESIDAGIPLIVIPVLADQLRNAHQIERNGIGMRLEKTDLAGGGKLEKAIREVLENDSYRKTAKKVRQMIADRPFAMKEIFVKNMEFLAKHGPLRQLDHYGRHLNFFQYYLVDVIAFVVLIVVSICVLVLLAIRSVLRRVTLRKTKQE